MRPYLIGLKSNPCFALLIAQSQALSMSSDPAIARPLPLSPTLDTADTLVLDTVQPGSWITSIKPKPAAKKQGNRAQRRAQERRR